MLTTAVKTLLTFWRIVLINFLVFFMASLYFSSAVNAKITNRGRVDEIPNQNLQKKNDFLTPLNIQYSDNSPQSMAPNSRVIETQKDTAVAVQTDVAYGSITSQTLDLCRSEGEKKGKLGVILIHGGGWTGGDKKDYMGWCKTLASLGTVAISLNYRLANIQLKDTWWPAQLADVELASRWVHLHADELGISPNRLCALGDSAGAHLALFLGSIRTNIEDKFTNQISDQESRVTCVVDNFGPVDLTDPSFLPGEHLAMFGGRTLQESLVESESASPLPLVSEASAPTLIAQGYKDRSIPYSQAERLLSALSLSNVQTIFIGFNGGHEWVGLNSELKDKLIKLEIDYLLQH